MNDTKRNYQKELTKLLNTMSEKNRLLLHCCCAPCSSYVLEYLHTYFDITVLFYNPNISEKQEYSKRKEELKRYIQEVSYGSEISILDAEYKSNEFYEITKGHERDPERGQRCSLCFLLRLEKTAQEAAKGKYDYFCTTLSISPHKDADLMMQIGERLGVQYKVSYLPSDFKKLNGYKRSIELSTEHHLYRQDYCGCIYSREQREKEKIAHENRR